MAIRDVKEYYATMAKQYTEMKADLADFDQAFKDGHISEDQLEAARDEVAKVEVNFYRLAYIMSLLEMPNRKAKQAKYTKQNKKVLDEIANHTGDEASVIDENKSALDDLRAELKKLTK